MPSWMIAEALGKMQLVGMGHVTMKRPVLNTGLTCAAWKYVIICFDSSWFRGVGSHVGEFSLEVMYQTLILKLPHEFYKSRPWERTC